MSHALWENQPPTLAKSATDFGKISDRFWEAPFLGNNRLCFWKKNVSVFGTKFGKIGSLFGLAWDKSSTLTVLNAWHVWVWFYDSKLGVSKNKSTGSKLEG